MTALDRLEAIHQHLSRFRFYFTNERELQAGLLNALDMGGFKAKSEFRLTPQDRLDFFAEGVAIEVKIGGSAADVMRQVSRYAEHDLVQGILLVTTKAKHSLPTTFNGKPLLVLSLLDGAF
jgi:hypothetical protein